jgi:hypothetical protein
LPVESNFLLKFCKYLTIGAYEYLLKKSSGSDIDVSRLFIYYNARDKGNKTNGKITDGGCTVTHAIESLQELGTCLESIWPYNTTEVNKRPNDEAFGAAEDNKIVDALQLKPNLDEMKTCLAQGFPFVFGLCLFNSFDHAKDHKGVVPTPKEAETARGTHGRSNLISMKR